MTDFIHNDFLLESEHARELYHTYAASLPIIDYHCHLPPAEVAEDRKYKNLTQLWIEGDHYKWRAMRQLGIEERLITGSASDKEKFMAWASTVPYTLRNPLYHWTHLELTRYFGITDLLTPDNAAAIYDQVNEMLKDDEFSARGLIRRMNVNVVCTTDDPLDELTAHKQVAGTEEGFRMLPTYRPDGLINAEKDEFADYLRLMGQNTGVKIRDWESLKEAVMKSIRYFHDRGCRLSDHGLPHAYGEGVNEAKASAILKKRLTGTDICPEEEASFKSAIMHFLATCYDKMGWTMQLHLGPIRNTNKAMLERIGIDAGVDSIGDFKQAEELAAFLNKLNEKGSLPKTILYNSNPADNEVFATMAGNFSQEGIRGKVQFGAAWWFMDQKDGITRQIEALSNMGLLSCTIGMLTDSRSFLSFPRHEYYRRVLCNILGDDMQKGYLPKDMKWIGKVVEDICYNNASEYFKFPRSVGKNLKAV
ncbi:glucuronate isomerase [Roseivirga sp. BDSF3-8]|uniref:glucuronate isomerase n=1 Tax=Roseivirga sp. BDSF3-8 TaxID=3241598 RepID=UPI003531D2E4